MRSKISKQPWVIVAGIGIILLGIYLYLDSMYLFFVLLLLIVWQGITTRRYMTYLASLLIPSLALLMIEHSVNHSLVGTTMLMIAFIIIVWQAVGVTLIAPKDLLKYFLANVAGVMMFVLIFDRGEIFTKSPAEWVSNNSWWLSAALIVPVLGIAVGWIGRDMMNAKPIDKWSENSSSILGKTEKAENADDRNQ